MAWRNALGKTLQELRIHLDQVAPASQGVRDFLKSNYAEMKKANPAFSILVREATGAEAKLTARYGFGVEKSVSVQGDKPEAIVNKLESLIKAGESLPNKPSVGGMFNGPKSNLTETCITLLNAADNAISVLVIFHAARRPRADYVTPAGRISANLLN